MNKENSDKQLIEWNISSKIQIINIDDKKELLINGRPYMRWFSEDETAQRFAIVQLYELEFATQEEIASAFQLHINSIYNYVTAYKINGIEGLISQISGPKQSWKITPEMRFKILEVAFRNRESSYEEMVSIIERRWNKKISVNSLRAVLIENGFIEERIRKNDLEEKYLFQEYNSGQLEINFSTADDKREIDIPVDKQLLSNEKKIVMKDESNISDLNKIERRRKSFYSKIERKYLDNLERGEYNAYAGGLLFVPLIEQYNYISIMKQIIDIGEEGDYDLRHLCLTLFYFDLFGFSSIENFKTVYAEEFGILIGKLNSPSIYTLRRFLYKVGELKNGEKLIEEFAKEYIKSGLVKWGILYIDGHFMPYYGMYLVSMGFYTIRQIPFKGSYNFLSVDEKFTPWLFLVRSTDEDLIEKIPEIIEKAKKISRECGIKEEDIKNLIVVFDREGYSAELFRKLDEMKVNHITWAKYFDRWVHDIPEEKFNLSIEVSYEIQKSKMIKYFETERVMSKYGNIRTIAIESGKDLKRAAIYTNNKELDAGEIIKIICKRWSEENLIKELLNKHMIDYSPGYLIEELEEQPMVDNPVIEKLKKEKGNLVSKINKLKIEIADNILEDKKPKELEEVRKKEIEIKAEIAILNHQVFKINEEIEKLPREVRYDLVHEGKKLVKFNYERKRFLDCIKVFVYNMEKKMCNYLSKYYDNRKDIYSVLTMIINRGANIKLKNNKLYVRFKRFKNQEVDYAARHLCEDLNQINPKTLDKFHFSINFDVE